MEAQKVLDEAAVIKAIEAAIEQGESLPALAKRLELDLVAEGEWEEYDGYLEPQGPAILVPGYLADDGNCEVHYLEADDGDEAARDYVDDGDWSSGCDEDDERTTFWISVHTWRRGYALLLDPEDPPELVAVMTDKDSHHVTVDPEEPKCRGDEDHNWCSPYSVLGGLEENPGVHGHGGGVVIKEVCSRCGWYKVTDTWAQDPTCGIQGLESTAYNKPDEASSEWAEQHCDKCGKAVTEEARRIGWPVETLEQQYVCPDCYGDEAFCSEGHVMSGEHDDCCPTCESDGEED